MFTTNRTMLRIHLNEMDFHRTRADQAFANRDPDQQAFHKERAERERLLVIYYGTFAPDVSLNDRYS